MTSADKQQSTIHLVAPELAPGIENFPTMDFSAAPIEEIRAGMMDREMPPMPEELKAVKFMWTNLLRSTSKMFQMYM